MQGGGGGGEDGRRGWGLIRFIFIFLNQIWRTIYDPSGLNFLFWYLSYNKWRQANMKSQTFRHVSNPIQYLERIYCKHSSIISSALSLIMILMLWLLQWFANSSSLFLENIKLIPIFNWIIHVSDFLKSVMTSFKYGLLSLKYSLVIYF